MSFTLSRLRGRLPWRHPARRLVPHPVDTLEDAERFMHRDLESAASDALSAEHRLIDHELARRSFRQFPRPRIVVARAGGGFTDDVTWLKERLARLTTELRRRRGAVGHVVG